MLEFLPTRINVAHYVRKYIGIEPGLGAVDGCMGYTKVEILAGIAPLVAMQNSHGIDLHFLNRTLFYIGLRTSAAIESAFDCDSPGGGTPTGRRVNDILDAYTSTLRYYRGLMPLNLSVITDGEANDEEILHMSIEEHLTNIVHRVFPAHQFGTEFV